MIMRVSKPRRLVHALLLLSALLATCAVRAAAGVAAAAAAGVDGDDDAWNGCGSASGAGAQGSRRRLLAQEWCVAKANLADSDYQGVLDWVCGQLTGQGQVNCSPIQSGQSCYSPDTYQGHASWAMNAYFQAQGQSNQACDFQGTGTITTTDPSTSTCSYTAPNGTSTSLINGSSGAVAGIHYHSRRVSYLSALVSILAYLTAA